MADLVLKSKSQILGTMLSTLLAQTGVNDLNPGSVIVTLLELAAAEDFQQYFQLLNVIRNYNLDTTTGTDLDNRAYEFGLTRIPAEQSTGLVNILRASGFEKVSTSLYTGFPAPLAGDTTIYVNDASNALYGSSGTLIIGRGTSDEEQVTYSMAPVNNTNYWQFTVSALANNHSVGESVILSQGTDVNIIAGTILQVPATSNSPQINFTVDQDTVLLSGEAEVDNVPVTCTVPGSIGNIPVQVINGTGAFTNPPFPGAQAFNLSKFTNGTDLESDDDLRNRIKNTIQTLSRGTQLAVQTAIVGLVDTNTAKRVVSANIIEPTSNQDPVKVYIDDGTGFEPSFSSQSFETLVGNAAGGESRLQLTNFPLVKAQVESQASGPYDMSSGTLTLTYTVGLESETISFFTSDFSFSNSVTAQEIVALINARSDIIEARTANSGVNIVLGPVSDTNEDIQVTGGTANNILLFPTTKKSTLLLYKNDVLLSKDGSTAFIDSVAGPFNFLSIGSSPWPLVFTVDGKTANPITVTFSTGNFASSGAATALEVVNVINAQAPGVTAALSNNNSSVRISSNTELSSASEIQITGGTANAVLQFTGSLVTGKNNDYTLNPELGQIQLNESLSAGDLLTSGSEFTRAYQRSTIAEPYSVVSGQSIFISIDGGGFQTLSFSSTGSFTAQQIANIINPQLTGATAISRKVGESNYLEIRTNSYDPAFGGVYVSNTSGATGIPFNYNVTATNQTPVQAYVVNTLGSPYAFVQGDNLVVIMDNNSAVNTFNVVMNYSGAVSSVSGASQFSCASFNVPFSVSNALAGYYAIFTSGSLTTTGTVTNISNPTGHTFRYSFSSFPTNLGHFAANDHVTFSGFSNLTNNGSFLVTAVNTSGNGYIEVFNENGVIESNTGSALLGQRRQINAYNQASGTMTVSSAFFNAPSIGDSFFVAPASLDNVVGFMNNLRITSLSLIAEITVVDNDTYIQIASLQDGSSGFVQVTGGYANAQLGFPTTQVQGISAYDYYTGLTSIVNKTIYGDDTDLVTYPGIGAAGVNFQVLPPTVNEVEVEVVLTLANGVSISSVQDNVVSAISGYINGLGISQAVIVSEIIDVIMNLTNISDVEVLLPAANIQIKDNELARTRSSLITVS